MHGKTGSCLCGAVRYVLNGDAQGMAICHCTHCQRQSGSAFSVNILVKEADFLQQGDTRSFADIGDSGLTSYRHFCGACGSPILTRDPNLPGIVLVKAGTLDEAAPLTPQLEIYREHAVTWHVPVSGAVLYPRSPATP